MNDMSFTIFSRASAKAERDLSSLYGMCMFVDQNKTLPPQIKQISDLQI